MHVGQGVFRSFSHPINYESLMATRGISVYVELQYRIRIFHVNLNAMIYHCAGAIIKPGADVNDGGGSADSNNTTWAASAAAVYNG